MGNLLHPDIYAQVRLKPTEVDAIVKAFKEHFASTDHLWIFGSRVDLQARGGDIDLYIETQKEDADKIYEQRGKFVLSLWREIGEQRIDVVVKLAKSELQLPIYHEAIKNGVNLV